MSADAIPIVNICPNCGEDNVEIDDNTGWCIPCAAEYRVSQATARGSDICLACGEPILVRRYRKKFCGKHECHRIKQRMHYFKQTRCIGEARALVLALQEPMPRIRDDQGHYIWRW
jgi:hypothetical protein